MNLIKKILAALFGFTPKQPTTNNTAPTESLARADFNSIMEEEQTQTESQITTVAKPVTEPAKVIKVSRKHFRAPAIESLAVTPLSAKKVMIDGMVWKRNPRKELVEGLAEYRRPHHPHGTRRFLPPPLVTTTMNTNQLAA